MSLQARLDHFLLDIETLNDEMEKAIAKNEYPYTNGADLQNMGAGPSSTRFRVYFSGARYEEHKDFLAYLGNGSDFELVHPELGVKHGEIEQISANYDPEYVDTVAIDFTFIEQGISTEPAVVNSLAPAVDDLYAETRAEQLEMLKNDLAADLGVEGRVIAGITGPVAEAPGLTIKGRYVADLIEKATAFLNEYGSGTNPHDSIVSLTETEDTLAGRFIYSLSLAVERLGEDAGSVAGTPSLFISRFKSSCAALKNSITFAYGQSQVLVSAAIYAVVMLAKWFEDDDQSRSKAKQLENIEAFDIEGNYLSPDPMPDVYTINELEKTSALAREMIQEALDTNRSLFSLREAAARLTAHVDITKLERERIETVEVAETLPLHALLLRLGLPATSAERVLTINNFWNPNFITGSVKVYVR
jgi:prophage DNA circulation protein